MTVVCGPIGNGKSSRYWINYFINKLRRFHLSIENRCGNRVFQRCSEPDVGRTKRLLLAAREVRRSVVALEPSPRPASPLAQPVEVVLFFTHPVRGIFGMPYSHCGHVRKVELLRCHTTGSSKRTARWHRPLNPSKTPGQLAPLAPATGVQTTKTVTAGEMNAVIRQYNDSIQ